MLGLHCNHAVLLSEHISALLLTFLNAAYARLCIGTEIIVPTGIAYVLLDHHAVPLAAGHLLIIICAQLGITLKVALAALCPVVCGGIVVAYQFLVHGLAVIHIVDVAHGLYGEQYYLLISVTVFGLELEILTQSLSLQTCIIVANLLKLTGLKRVVLACIQHLGADTAVVLAAQVKNTCSLGSLLLTKELLAELVGVIQQVVYSE